MHFISKMMHFVKMTDFPPKHHFFGEPELPGLALCKRAARTKQFLEVRGAVFSQEVNFTLKSALFDENDEFLRKVPNVDEKSVLPCKGRPRTIDIP